MRNTAETHPPQVQDTTASLDDEDALNSRAAGPGEKRHRRRRIQDDGYIPRCRLKMIAPSLQRRALGRRSQNRPPDRGTHCGATGVQKRGDVTQTRFSNLLNRQTTA